MRQAVIYISVPKELKRNYDSVFREQNTACLETAICYDLVIQKTFFDYKGKIYNKKRPNFDWLVNYLEKKTDKQYIIILQNLSLITPITSELEEILRLVRRRIKGVKFVEADEFNNHTELLKHLGLYFNQHSFVDMMEG